MQKETAFVSHPLDQPRLGGDVETARRPTSHFSNIGPYLLANGHHCLDDVACLKAMMDVTASLMPVRKTELVCSTSLPGSMSDTFDPQRIGHTDLQPLHIADAGGV